LSLTIDLCPEELEGLTRSQCNALLVDRLANNGVDARLDDAGEITVSLGRLVLNNYVGVNVSITWSYEHGSTLVS